MGMTEGTMGMVGIGLVGVAGIGAIVFGDGSRTTEVIAFSTAIAGMIAALVRGGVGGSGGGVGGTSGV